MTERRPTTSALEAAEDGLYAALETSQDPQEVPDTLIMLGLTHLWMEPSKLGLGFQEIWAGMHGRSGIENLGTVAQVLSCLGSYGTNPLSLEHAAVLEARQQAKAA